ncbi:MAG: hypothetical protein AAFZ74_00550 [Pseudomonadota bacterium]
MSLTRLKPWHIALSIVALIAALVALWPLGIGRDYMNHLARTYIQASLGSDVVLQQYYAVSFGFIPDLTMDLIVPWLSQVIGIYAAGAFTVWLALALPPLAGLVLAKSLHGRVTWVSLLGFLTMFNANIDLGFINYTVSSGLALLAFALWIRMSPGWRRTLVFFPIGLAIVINHAIAFLLLGFLAFAWETISFAKGERGSLTAFARQCVCLDLPAMLGGLAFLAVSMQGATDLPQDVVPLYHFGQKAGTLLAATQFGHVLVALAASFSVIAFFWVGVRQKWFVFADKAGWLCAVFLGLVIVMPTAIFGIWGLHLRFTAPLLIVAAASIVPTAAMTARTRSAMVAGFSLVFAASVGNGAIHMAENDQQAAAFKPILADLPEGSKVLSVFADPEIDSAFTAHAVTLAVIERAAFVPNLFTNTSPVDVAAGMVDLHMPQSLPLLIGELDYWAQRPPAASQNGYWSPEFASGWPERWDYILLFKGDRVVDLSRHPVCAVSATPEVILYKIEPCA